MFHHCSRIILDTDTGNGGIVVPDQQCYFGGGLLKRWNFDLEKLSGELGGLFWGNVEANVEREDWLEVFEGLQVSQPVYHQSL